MSFHLNPLHLDPHFNQKTQTIYIDPQQLIAFKSKRKPFTMVPSVFEPPQDQLSLKEHTSWNQTTQHSLSNYNNLHNSQKKFSKNLFENDRETFPQQKIKLLQELLQGQSTAPNVQFIWKLLPSTYKKHIINFQQGDCIPFKGLNDQKYLILSGQVRIIGINDHQFKRKAGYLFFLSNDTCSKIKQIVSLRSTKILKIPNNIYQSLIKNYLYLKNSEKIKFIQFCPFLIWKYQLTEDLASCMEVKLTEKEQIIYQANSLPDFIYFVKQGIVLLERNNKLMNPVVEDYEQYYQKNQISQKDTILVVRKGMAFGIDGIIIKEFTASAFSTFQIQQVVEANEAENLGQQNIKQAEKKRQEQKPEGQNISKGATRKNTRIYSAKTLGKCELYCLDKKILETLFSISDIEQEIYTKKKQVRAQQLQRMSIEYTNILLKNIKPQMAQVPLKKKELVLKVQKKSFPKSKSLSGIENKESKMSINHERLNNSPKALLFRNKKLSSVQNIRAQSILKSQFYLNQQKQRNQLRNRIKSQRQREKMLKVKKSNNQTSMNKRDNQEVYMLPKIGGNTTQNQQNSKRLVNKKQKGQENILSRSKTTNKKYSTRQTEKLKHIIGMKLKQSIKDYQLKATINGDGQSIEMNNKNISNISITNHYMSKDSELSKLLQQSNQSKSNPSFINIKSYKSIISVYQTNKNHNHHHNH